MERHASHARDISMQDAEFDALRALSARIGRDIEQVQASGGNTSIKIGDTLHVKASGLWLADSLDDDVFVPVSRRAVLDAIGEESEDGVRRAVIDGLNPKGLRPSIETSMHALLEHRVVLHTHSVRTLALAVCSEAEAMLASRLDGLSWAFIPYCKPGMDLTVGIRSVLADAPDGTRKDILVLGNHGLVVGADSVAEAGALLARVEGLLDAPRTEIRAEIRAEVRSGEPVPSGWKRVDDPLVDSMAASERLRKLALSASWYPDHVVFLGPAASATPDGIGKLMIRPDGAFLPDDASVSAVAMVRCLAHVLHRIPPDRELRHLDSRDELALMDWDAEKYRQALER